MTNTLVSHYVVRPSEPDGDIVFVVRNWLGYAVLVTDSAVDAAIVARRMPGATITAAASAEAVERAVADYARRPFTY